MRVTSVELTMPFHRNLKGKFCCWGKIVLDDVLLVTGIRLFENRQNDEVVDRYIRFPDRQPSLNSTGGEFVSIAVVNTNNEELRRHITEAVFEAYDKHPKNPKNFRNRETNNRPPQII